MLQNEGLAGEEQSIDVAIIGGGLAGLCAARELRHDGVDVVVFEANDRVGGRVLNKSIGEDSVVDCGGEWVGPQHTHILELATEYGIETVPTPHEGKDLLYYRDQRRPFEGAMPDLPLHAKLDLVQAQFRLDRMAQKVPHEAPWNAPNANQYDRTTLGAWLKRNTFTEGARTIFELVTALGYMCLPRDISLLFFLTHISSAGSLETLTDSKDGAVSKRFKSGATALPEHIANELDNRVVLGCPVHALEQDDDEVSIRTEQGTVVAERAIVAVDPGATAHIDFDPRLPLARDELTDRWASSKILKVHVLYERPFWHEQGLSGAVLSDSGFVRFTLDSSPPDAQIGVLTGLTGTPVTDDSMGSGGSGTEDPSIFDAGSRDERFRAVVEALTNYFGPAAREPIQYVEKNWADEPWIEGCSPQVPPGLLTSYGSALTEPVGRIHWAGAETSPVWAGHMEGAVRSGEHAAEQVMELLE
ncbi:flavin monoamine oxidase family protein [Natrialba sp. SSL1]|uniref:flavin monoamine oxidase family protein n=1 Tax=Natrialba sp. SSL1 TaxID=1869245 RepID=UPI0008F7EB9E|nr:FAD-dependent oxidoreductase [Natrialba sp. SSL1]OIB59089.1 hypothetical protein BBD46_06210 [Natrialba sp. SSL1]